MHAKTSFVRLLLAGFTVGFSVLQPVQTTASSSQVLFDNLSEVSANGLNFRANQPAGQMYETADPISITRVTWKSIANQGLGETFTAEIYSSSTQLDGNEAVGSLLGTLSQSSFDSNSSHRVFSNQQGVTVTSGKFWLYFKCNLCFNSPPQMTTSSNKTGAIEHAFQLPVGNPFRLERSGSNSVLRTDTRSYLSKIEGLVISPVITFKSNFAGGPADEIQTVHYGQASSLNRNAFSQPGFTFHSWNTQSDGTGLSYDDLDSVSLTANLELFAQWTPNPVSTTYTGPLITSLDRTILPSMSATKLRLSGERLDLITSLAANGLPLNYTLMSNRELIVSIPELAPGVYDFNIRHSGEATLTHQSAFTVSQVTGNPSTWTIRGFAGNSTKLPPRAEANIQRQLASQNYSKVTCIGSTSGTRATQTDRRLAIQRAATVCRVIKRILPSIEIQIQSAPASGLGPQFRNVRLNFIND